MEQVVGSDAESKLISILKILSDASEPLGSITIARKLEQAGVFLSERAVRYHLRIADERGYTQPAGRDGRMITPEGRQEVKEALAPQHLGFVREKLDTLAFQTTFDPEKRTGQLPVNTSLIDKDKASQQQIGKLQLDLVRAEKELTEANVMLLEMQGELKKWKEDVLGFRGEMRQSQKVLLEGVTRLHVLIGGGVAMDSPTTQPAPIVSNTRH